MADTLNGIPIWAVAFLVLFARVGAVLMVLPVFSEDAIPARIRLMIAFGMTAGCGESCRRTSSRSRRTSMRCLA